MSARVSCIMPSTEGFIEVAATQRLVASNVSVHVWLEKEGVSWIRVPDELRGLVAQFEGAHVRIQENREETGVS